jgi:peptidoglycan/xylan/chitin deacetylase (PgdA/CDA1 family)
MAMRSLLSVLLLVLCFVPPAGAAVPDHAVVFIYHRFGDDRYPSTDTQVSQFRVQLDWLTANHYQVWPLPRIVEYLKDHKPIPDHVVAITVDDAFQSFYENAYPLLKERDWPFTIFVSTGAVGDKPSDFMTWDELREMAKHGANYGDHTVDHGHLPFRLKAETDLAWADRVRADIEDAQARLQAELGKDANSDPKLFAYPYGEFSEELTKLVNGLGYVAFGQQAGVMSEPFDPRALPRFPIDEHYGDIQGFALRAAALPLPITSSQPWDPELHGNNPPRLEVSLTPGAVPPDALHCYLNGPPMKIEWLDEPKSRFALKSDSPIPEGRGRYNCTAEVGGRYFWYSHMWLQAPRP